jgi:hypothetical protein
MTVPERLLVLIASLYLAASACATKSSSLGDAAPTIRDFAVATEDLRGTAATLGEILTSDPPAPDRPVEESFPVTVDDVLRGIGRKVRAVMNEVKPVGDSDPDAVLVALAKADAGSRRRLAEAAGGREAPEAVVLGPAPSIVVDTTLGPQELDRRLAEVRGQRSDARDKRETVGHTIEADFFALACVALLAEPLTRARLAPHLAPADVPEVTPDMARELNLGGTTRSTWQQALFDGEGRLVLTPSGDSRYTLFRAWLQKVNPDLWRYANAFLRQMIRA